MRSAERGSYLRTDVERLFNFQRAPSQALSQRLAFDQLGYHKVIRVNLSNFMDCQNVWMIQG